MVHFQFNPTFLKKNEQSGFRRPKCCCGTVAWQKLGFQPYGTIERYRFDPKIDRCLALKLNSELEKKNKIK